MNYDTSRDVIPAKAGILPNYVKLLNQVQDDIRAGTSVLFVSPEAAPVAKVGGLADVVGSLPQTLRRQGWDARIILPRYERLDPVAIGARPLGKYPVLFGGQRYTVTLLKAVLPNSSVPLYLLSEPRWLSRGDIYPRAVSRFGRDYAVRRALFFCSAVWRGLPLLAWRADLLHLHDWMTAALTIYAQRLSSSFVPFRPLKTLLTIHNLDYQGYASDPLMRRAGIDPVILQARLINTKGQGYTNLLGQGIAAADAVNTVSPQYAREIRQARFGRGLEHLIRKRPDKVEGILNGIDVDFFNPRTDPAISARYDERRLEKKSINKQSLQKRLSLPKAADALLCGVVSRLTYQKGFELIIEAIRALKDKKLQFIILGQGDEDISRRLQSLQKQYPKSLAFVPQFDATLAQLIYAGSDVFLMPSAFEPCGLGQMIAMRYGTPPIVHDTGGLHDTVRDFRTLRGQGFVFKLFTAEKFLQTLRTAQKVFIDKKRWRKLQQTAMREDFSWETSAKKYLRLYRRILRG